MLDKNKIVMETDRLDDGSAVINFDLLDNNYELDKVGGYVMARMEDNAFVVNVFNARGDVLSETVVPFNFLDAKAIDEILDEEKGE